MKVLKTFEYLTYRGAKGEVEAADRKAARAKVLELLPGAEDKKPILLKEKKS